MSTPSTIATKFKNGQIKLIYCHFDGYVSHNGKILFKRYADQQKVEGLISMGCASSISETLETSKFYVRDYGEDWEFNQPKIFESYNSYLRYINRIKGFNYYFNGETWLLNDQILFKNN